MKSWCGLFLLSSGLLISASVGRGQTLPAFGHVVIVPLENNAYSSVVSSPSMPYLNSLISQYGLATQYFANTHPSIGNYFMLTTGQILTNDDSQTPSSFPVSVDNIARQVEVAGKTWKDYPEKTGSYIVRHDPLQYFTNINKANLTSFTQFKTDLANHALPNFSFITPNGCNDAHDCGLDVADSWLQTNIDPLVKSTYFQPGGDGLLIIVFDEDDGSEGNHVACVIISPLIASAGFQSSNTYHHQNARKLMAAGLGLSTSGLGAAANAATMSEFFKATSTGAPVVTLSATSLTFPNQTVGSTSAAQTVTLKNTGTASLTISSLQISGDFALAGTGNCSGSVAAAASCTINVNFTPAATGTRTGTVTITDNAAGSPQHISLTGSGVSGGTTGSLTLAPGTLTFPSTTVGSTSAAQNLTLNNGTSASVSITGISIGGTNSGDFAQTHTCGASLAAATACTISVTFKPTATGTRAATLSVADSAGTQTANLTGTGASSTSSSVTITPNPLTFPSTTVGTPSAVGTATVKNGGTSSLTFSAAFTITGDFAFDPNSGDCGSSLAAGSSCSITVIFTPTATGTRTGTVSISDNAPNSPQILNLTGSGVSSSGGGSASVSVSPSSLNFGRQTIGTTSGAKTVTVTNSGSAPVAIAIAAAAPVAASPATRSLATSGVGASR